MCIYIYNLAWKDNRTDAKHKPTSAGQLRGVAQKCKYHKIMSSCHFPSGFPPNKVIQSCHVEPTTDLKSERLRSWAPAHKSWRGLSGQWPLTMISQEMSQGSMTWILSFGRWTSSCQDLASWWWKIRVEAFDPYQYDPLMTHLPLNQPLLLWTRNIDQDWTEQWYGHLLRQWLALQWLEAVQMEIC